MLVCCDWSSVMVQKVQTLFENSDYKFLPNSHFMVDSKTDYPEDHSLMWKEPESITGRRVYGCRADN